MLSAVAPKLLRILGSQYRNAPKIDIICGYVSPLYCVSHYLYLENYSSDKKVYHPQLPVQYLVYINPTYG